MHCQIRKDTSGIPFPEFNTVKGVLDDRTYEACFLSPFLTDRKCLYLTAKAKDRLLEKLVSVSDDIENDVNIIIDGEFDKRSTVYRQAAKKKVLRSFDRLDGKKFNDFCLFSLKGAQITPDTFRYLVGRMQYGIRDDCDLYTVRNWLSALASGPQPIDACIIDQVIPEYIPAKVYRLFEFLSARDAESYFKLLDKLNAEDPHSGIGTLSMLLRSFRIAYKVSLVGAADAPSLLGLSAWEMKGTGSVGKEKAEKAMHLLQDGVNLIKKGYPAVQVTQELSCRLFSLLA